MQQEQIAVPTTIEGIAIHLGYISRNLADLNKKMDTIQSNTVNRDEWGQHLKKDEDHEARIRLLEKSVADKETEISNIFTTMKVWGIALGVFWSLIEVGLRFILK